MKKAFIILIVLFTMSFFSTQAQPPDPGNNPSGGGNGPLGGGAPIGSGTLILLTLGAAYGVNKYRKFVNNNELKE